MKLESIQLEMKDEKGKLREIIMKLESVSLEMKNAWMI